MDCIKAFSETDFTEDLRNFNLPTLIMHGDDQIVPIGASALLSAKIVKGATLKVYKGGSHGICTTQKDEVNADLLAFFKANVLAVDRNNDLVTDIYKPLNPVVLRLILKVVQVAKKIIRNIEYGHWKSVAKTTSDLALIEEIEKLITFKM